MCGCDVILILEFVVECFEYEIIFFCWVWIKNSDVFALFREKFSNLGNFWYLYFVYVWCSFDIVCCEFLGYFSYDYFECVEWWIDLVYVFCYDGDRFVIVTIVYVVGEKKRVWL